MADSKKDQTSIEKVDPLTMKPEPLTKKPQPKKIAPLAPPPSGLDWEKIRTEFEASYMPSKGPQGAGRLIAHIVVTAIIEIAKK